MASWFTLVHAEGGPGRRLSSCGDRRVVIVGVMVVWSSCSYVFVSRTCRDALEQSRGTRRGRSDTSLDVGDVRSVPAGGVSVTEL
jgi:hypothetical protein